jgi:anti-sigma regulatory factor (Ser/Thr protein kinase)
MSVALLEIGAVARELGVAPSTLRSWERRYRTVVPRRGPNGQRLYERDQVLVLRDILAQTRLGVRAGAAHQAAGFAAPLGSSRVRLLPSAEASLSARRAVDTLLDSVDGRRDEHFAFNLRLVASELVKNAVVHGDASQEIELEIQLYADWAELRVRNRGVRLALRNLRVKRRPGGEGGRGLEIIDALADGWTIDSGPIGTSITVRLSAVHDA